MGAVALSNAVYQTIADGQKPGVPYGHGQTYSGHPVSAAVALEVLRPYREGGVLENGQASGAYFEKKLALLADHPLVGDVRARSYRSSLSDKPHLQDLSEIALACPSGQEQFNPFCRCQGMVPSKCTGQQF